MAVTLDEVLVIFRTNVSLVDLAPVRQDYDDYHCRRVAVLRLNVWGQCFC